MYLYLKYIIDLMENFYYYISINFPNIIACEKLKQNRKMELKNLHQSNVYAHMIT